MALCPRCCCYTHPSNEYIQPCAGMTEEERQELESMRQHEQQLCEQLDKYVPASAHCLPVGN